MAAVVLAKTLDMDRAEWLEQRRNGIGGSDVAALAGLNPWKSPLDVYLEKIGQAPEQEENERMYWGNVLEDIVAKEFSLRSGIKVRKCNSILQHPEYPFMLANVDRLIVGAEEGLECKTTSEYQKGAWEGDEVPDYYILQCQHYMAVTGYKAWWIAVLIGGNKFIYKKIDRDEDIISYLIKIESEFWNKVENRVLPEVDGSPASSEALKVLYPESNPGTIIELPDEAESLLSRRDFLKGEIKHLEGQLEEAENKVKAFLGENESGVIAEYTVNWKTINSSRIDSKRLKAERPEIYSSYSAPSSYRKFDVKKRKGAK